MDGRFVPGTGNLVSAQPDTGFADAGAVGSWYKLSAIDAHGNESGFAVLGPGGTLDAPGGLIPRELTLERPAPNPASGPTTLRYTLARDALVSLAIYDAAGRRLREVTSGAQPAGPHTVVWDLHDDSGHAVAAGIYFVRLDAEGRRLTQRFATLR